MAFPALVKGASVGATQNPPSASTIINRAGTFAVKVWRIRGRWKLNDHAPTTGDGDLSPVYEGNNLQDGYYTIYGAVLSGVEIGIENLRDSTLNPGTFKLIRESGSGAGTTQTVSLLVLDLEYDMKRTGVYVPIVLSGIVTGTTPANVEATS